MSKPRPKPDAEVLTNAERAERFAVDARTAAFGGDKTTAGVSAVSAVAFAVLALVDVIREVNQPRPDRSARMAAERSL